MLDLQGLNAQDLQGLSPSSLADVAALMLTRIGEQSKFIGEQGRQLDERNKQITEQAQAIKFKDVKIERITFELARLKAYRFGAKTERMDAEQRQMFEEALAEDQASLEAQLLALQGERGQTAAPPPDEKTKSKPRRQALPEHLRRVEYRHEPENTTCECGQAMARIGEDITEKLDIVPAEFFVHRHVRGKWACKCCQTLVQQPVAPQIIDKGMPAPGLIAHVLVSRFVDHLPYYLLIYGYASGVFSSRKIERATYDSVAFRFVAANTHPDHDTIATFRRRFLPQVKALFVQVLMLAREMKCLKLGAIALDGTKVHANASKHKALSWAHANKIEAQLREEVQSLLALGEKADRAGVPDGMDVPAEIAQREQRLRAIDAAKVRIEQRAKDRYEAERQAHQAKVDRRQAQRDAGRTPRGKEPEPPEQGPRDSDQVSLTDEDSRIMPVSGAGFEQSYNAQAAVDTETMRVIATHVSQAANDMREITPVLDKVAALPGELGQVSSLPADTGYCSAANVWACEAQKIEPMLAMKRESHHLPVLERFAADAPPPESTDPVLKMAHRLATKTGRALYGLRKQTVEPLFGIIKHVMGWRQMSMRGLDKAEGEWSLVTMAWNVKRLHVLQGA